MKKCPKCRGDGNGERYLCHDESYFHNCEICKGNGEVSDKIYLRYCKEHKKFLESYYQMRNLTISDNNGICQMYNHDKK
jgi:hypothetical protein